MDNKSKILIGIFFALVVGATVWKYYVFFIKQDFVILNQIACDTSVESCFVVEDELPFKKISKNAENITACNSETCPELTCEPEEEDCVITLCSEESLEGDEVCIYEPVPDQAIISE